MSRILILAIVLVDTLFLIKLSYYYLLLLFFINFPKYILYFVISINQLISNTHYMYRYNYYNISLIRHSAFFDKSTHYNLFC